MSTHRHHALALGSILLLAALVYLNALGNGFVYDDHRLILENRSLYSLRDWQSVLWHDISRPLVNLSYAVDYAIWGGPHPFGFHLTNLVIHLVNAGLLYRLALGLAADCAASRPFGENGSGNASAVAAGLVFAVHPMLTQAVGYVSARSELLCAMFLLIALLFARRAFRRGGVVNWGVTVGSWLLALAAKEIAVMFPVVLLAYDYFLSPESSEARKRRLSTVHIPLLSMMALAAVTRLVVLLQLERSIETVVRWRFALVELEVLARYLLLMLWPRGQTVFHAITPIEGLGDPRAWAALAMAGSFAWAIWAARRMGVVSLGLTWFALLLLPSAALVVLDRGEPMAEHRVYAASVGFFLCAGTLAARLSQRLEQVSARAARRARDVGFVLLGILCLETISRNVVWHRPISLWLEAAEYAPNHWLPRLALGESLHEEGRHEEAVTMFQQSVTLRPTALAYAKLGACQLETGHLADATESFERLRRIEPDSAAASTGLGLIALRARDSTVARGYFLEALTRNPDNVAMRQSLAAVVEAIDPQEALHMCEEIERLAPGTPGNAECIRRNRERIDAPAVPPR